jgi:hydrogenase-4 component B
MHAFFFALLFYIVGAILTLVLCKKRRLVGSISLVANLIACLSMWFVVFNVFRHGTVLLERPLWTIPGIQAALYFRIDPLSALFLAIISLMAVLVALYSRDYMKLSAYQSYSLAAFYPVLSLFFAGVSCVVAVTDMFFFFIFWEIMTLTSYVLVVFDKNDPAKVKAGLKYFIITHIATVFMFLAAIILFKEGGSFSFQGQSDAMALLLASQPGLLHLVLLFFFLGFATKAGILPMGDWLPGAYAAAPTPATAAFAGSMTKLGVYGIIRIFADFLPVSGHTQLWGVIIALFGTVSIFIGTLTALVQDDAKKLLSFHVIGQMGYMFLSIGAGIYFLASQPALAMVGISAGIFHLINNVCYKSCLFFNAGSVYWKVGTFDINKVGGLSRILPLTGVLTLLAAFSISGLPPFNGFVSKWLIFQMIIKGGMQAPLFILLAIFAIFISAVTLASFIKFSTALFYGKYADQNSHCQRGEVPGGMLLCQGLLVLFCILLGVLPLWPLHVIQQAVTNLFPPGTFSEGLSLYGTGSVGGIALNFGTGIVAGWNPLFLVLVFIICFCIVFALYRSGGAAQRVDETWYCGELQKDQEVRYQAHSYYLAFKQMFTIRMGSYQRSGVYPTIKYPKINFSESAFLKKLLNIDHWLYDPLVAQFNRLTIKFSATHSGVPHVYLLWLLIGAMSAVTLLFWLH